MGTGTWCGSDTVRSDCYLKVSRGNDEVFLIGRRRD